MRFYVIRHGQTDRNASGIITGQADIPITEEGAAQVAAAVRDIPNDVAVIYSSDLIRTRQTTEILNKSLQLPVVFDARLRERNFGSLEGREWASFDVDGSLHVEDDLQRYDYHAFGGESVEDVKKRLFDALKDIESTEKGKTALIVAHGGIIRLLKHLEAGAIERHIQNGSVHEFNITL